MFHNAIKIKYLTKNKIKNVFIDNLVKFIYLKHIITNSPYSLNQTLRFEL